MADMIEISADQHATYLKAIKLLDGLLSDKDKGLDIKRQIQKLSPEVKFPELDIIETASAPLRAELNETKTALTSLQKLVDEDRAKVAEREGLESTRATLAKVQAKFHLTDEGLEKVKERMLKNNNPDAEAAAYAVLAEQPKPAPTAGAGYAPAAMNLYGAGEKSDDANVASLHNDPMKWMDREVTTMLDEFAQAAA